MAALTVESQFSAQLGTTAVPDLLKYGVKAASKILLGALACIDTATGYAVKGSTATTLKAIGRAEETADNLTGASGDIKVLVRKGIFRFNNSAAGDLIALTEIGTDCYIVDDQTVAKTSGGATRSVAGKVELVDSDGVWVRVGVY